MKILRIRLEGFRGVLTALDIPCGAGFTVICGRNGAGKSTVCDAIEFVLRGSLAVRGGTERGEYISNYLWWRGNPSAQRLRAAVDFCDSAGEEFTVERTP